MALGCILTVMVLGILRVTTGPVVALVAGLGAVAALLLQIKDKWRGLRHEGATVGIVLAVGAIAVPIGLATRPSENPPEPPQTSTAGQTSSTTLTPTTSEPTTSTPNPPTTTSSAPPPPVDPWETYYLFDMQALEAKGNWDPRGTSIDGRVYPKSIVGNDIGYLDALGNTMEGQYNLRRSCSRLTFTGGVTDDSPSGTSARFEVSVDNMPRMSRDAKFGESFKASLDVSGALRLKLSITSLTHTALAAAFGDAQIKCALPVTPSS